MFISDRITHLLGESRAARRSHLGQVKADLSPRPYIMYLAGDACVFFCTGRVLPAPAPHGLRQVPSANNRPHARPYPPARQGASPRSVERIRQFNGLFGTCIFPARARTHSLPIWRWCSCTTRARHSSLPLPFFLLSSSHPAPQGRKLGGGIRLGEMERDSLLAHGVSFLLQDRLMHCSDEHRVGTHPPCIIPSPLSIRTTKPLRNQVGVARVRRALSHPEHRY